jgi:hypothetical protein
MDWEEQMDWEAYRQPPKHYRIRRTYEIPSEFFTRFRMSPRLFEILLGYLANTLTPKAPTNKALTSGEKLLVFLRFVATNEFYWELQDTQG